MYKVIEKDKMFYIEDTMINMVLETPHKSKDEALEQIKSLTKRESLSSNEDNNPNEENDTSNEENAIYREIEIIPYAKENRYKGAWEVEERCRLCEHLFVDND